MHTIALDMITNGKLFAILHVATAEFVGSDCFRIKFYYESMKNKKMLVISGSG